QSSLLLGRGNCGDQTLFVDGAVPGPLPACGFGFAGCDSVISAGSSSSDRTRDILLLSSYAPLLSTCTPMRTRADLNLKTSGSVICSSMPQAMQMSFSLRRAIVCACSLLCWKHSDSQTCRPSKSPSLMRHVSASM